jgi:hypothetical protein
MLPAALPKEHRMQIFLDLFDAVTCGSIVGAAFMAGFLACSYTAIAFGDRFF